VWSLGCMFGFSDMKVVFLQTKQTSLDVVVIIITIIIIILIIHIVTDKIPFLRFQRVDNHR
jgi:hypothetical protein